MPVLDWIGKNKVVSHHLEVPYHVLACQYTFGKEDEGESGNKIIHGDNLLALKSLLPEYEGRVNCIYIDPPYNTGNEGWIYNDNVNDPHIKKWLGQVVGSEGDDLSRHDKWLCMMYPRLKLLQRLLAENGAIFISIDDNEQANLKLICDEIFGKDNFLADLIWQHSLQSNGYSGKFVSQFNHTIVYAKSNKFILGNLPRTEENDKSYRNPDNDPKGKWRAGYCVNGLYRPNLKYDIITPSGNVIFPPEKGWRWSKDTLQSKIAAGEIIFNNDETNIIHKLYLKDLNGKVPENIWLGKDAGTTRQASSELKNIFSGKSPFDTPKPTSFIERIIQISTDKNSIVLDSFAGSGTTAHAVLNLNKGDGGNRKFILVEMMDYAESITAERVRRVIKGYGTGRQKVTGTGGDFSYYELGEPLLDGENLNERVGIDKLRAYVYFTETRQQLEEAPAGRPYYLGTHFGAAYYFCYERDRRVTLSFELLAEQVSPGAESYVIFADQCALSEAQLVQYHITFKKIPRDITRL